MTENRNLAIVAAITLVVFLALLVTPLKSKGYDCGSAVQPDDTFLEDVSLNEGVTDVLRSGDLPDCDGTVFARRALAAGVGILGLGGLGLVLAGRKLQEDEE